MNIQYHRTCGTIGSDYTCICKNRAISGDPQIYVSIKMQFFFKSWKLVSSNTNKFTA